ncbi:GNAT family N-acetyltransferase [Dankookia sp. P2]|uniref:GNAT family N-acetyltransferase n=1 Tax=Dankookia sp. P2 TaxID=3423955 RepID=UPI003D668781
MMPTASALSRLRMSVMIRAVTMADAAAFRAIRLEALRLHPGSFGAAFEEESSHDVASFAAGLPRDPPDAVFGAWLPDDPEPLGMAGLYAERRRKLAHKGHVWGVYVREAARGQGIGRAMLEGAIAAARGAGLETLLLTVSVEAPAAQALYRGLGFRAYGTEPRGLRLGPGHYVDEVLMALDLCGA